MVLSYLRIQFNNTFLVVEKNNYSTKIVNAYIVYDLDDWPKIPLNNFKLKKCFFDATNIAKDIDKGQWVYGGYGIAFDGAGLLSFGINFARNNVICGVDISSSSHGDNHKNNFLILDEGPTDDINRRINAAERKFSIIFSKAKIKFSLGLHYSHDYSYFFVNGKDNYKFIADKENFDFPTQFYLGSISDDIYIIHNKYLMPMNPGTYLLKEVYMIFRSITKL